MMVVRTAAMQADSRHSERVKDRVYIDPKVMHEDDDEREEGEIVDDYDPISSEDEEFKLRARIQQLEENNKDVERMDMLAANLANQYNYPELEERALRLPRKSPVFLLSDVSSHSDDEYDSQRHYHRSRLRRIDNGRRSVGQLPNGVYKRTAPARRYKPQHLRNRQPTQSYKSYQHQRPNHQQHYHQQQQQDAILLDSFESLTDEENCEYDVTSENEGEDVLDLERLKLSRDKLRVALAREERNDMLGQYKNSLRERLQYPLRKSPKKYPTNKELLSPSAEQLTDGLCPEEEEQEHAIQPAEAAGETGELSLRLIALKSAILKKHLARKKRDAERAYSPTDMINRVHPTISNTDEIDDLMEISPAASPDRGASPYRMHDAVDTKSVDMDLAETDSDEQKDNWNTWSNNWNSLDTAGGSWRCFMPNSSLPPVSMPIVIDDDDDLYDDEEPPPPPPFQIAHMHLDEDARDAMHLVDEQNSNHSSLTYTQSVSMENSQTQTKSVDISHPETSDDEAGALRAMLLSNLKTAKEPSSAPAPAPTRPPLLPTPVLHYLPPAPVPAPSLAVSITRTDSIGSHDSDDPEQLRSLLLSSIATKKGRSCPTLKSRLSPEILKNAVRRFQSCAVEAPPKVDEPEEPQDDIQQQPIEEGEKMEQEEPLQLIVEAPSKGQDSNQSAMETEQHHQPESSQVLRSKDPTSPSTKIIKIVKPNKVINKKTTTKRKIPTEEQSSAKLSCKRPTTLMIKEPSASVKVQSNSSVTRLVTSIDRASIKVSKLIISLADDSAASDDNLELSSCFDCSNYTENASPLSLAMGSPSGSTTRSNTPTSEILESASASTSNPNLRRSVMSDYLEKKIDDYLKQARSKVPTPGTNGTKEPETDKAPEKTADGERLVKNPPKAAPSKTQQTKKTPVAVRHLPVASQKEYLRLVERMQLLEQKKLTTAKKKEAAAAAASGKATAATLGETTNDHDKVVQTAAINSSSSSSSSQRAAIPNETKAKTNVKPNQPTRETRLKSFESSFARIGGSMIANLEKSMKLVEEAKKSKAVRLRCSHRLKELYSEMQAVRQVVKQEEVKLARIQPEIQTSHEIIISLKQKRNKLYAAAMDLGKGLSGDEYRLLDEGKAEITRKSTQLSKQIRLYNSIVKYDDLKKLTEEQQQQQPLPPTENESQPQTVIESPVEREDETSRTSIEADRRQPEENGISTDTAQVPCSEPPPTETADECESQLMPDNQTRDDSQPEPEPALEPEVVAVAKPWPGPYTVRIMRELREEEAEPDTYLQDYRSPIPRNYSSPCDVHATICPFELMGRCEDADCSYLHLGRVETTPLAPAPALGPSAAKNQTLSN
ncbi:FK506-binding protein 5 [Drosophila obscura]|uniref:FK506-binding protein 5 n=1 Tax=Drosophila obscura TaxID=7282 RepID=UPI001BB15291|nr:FK506-binding protein 5 [Drosophila obscura]